MSSVNPNSKDFTYNVANAMFKAPAKMQAWATKHTTTDSGLGAKVQNGAVKLIGSLGKDIVDYDYREFPRLALGNKFSVPLSSPPKGALLLLLYPGTVIPRLYRAYQRGKENNDYREMGDVLRRDLTAITLFVFALGPVVKTISAFTQGRSGVNLLDPKGNSVLKYSQFKDYVIDKPGVLKAILAEGNGKALLSAVNGLHDRGLKGDPTKGETLAAAIQNIQNSVKELVTRFEAHNVDKSEKVWPSALDKTAKETQGLFDKAEAMRAKALTEAKKAGSADMVKIAQKMEGEFKGVLQNYAKVRRLPGDLVSFALMVGAIGYLPMWVNTEWNKRQFEKKMTGKAAHEQKNAQPQQQPAAMSAPTTFGLNSGVQPQWALHPQPFGTMQSQARQTPFFNRTV